MGPCSRTPDLGIPPCTAHLPRFRVSQGPDSSAGHWAGAGTGCLGLGLVAAQVSTGGGAWFNIGCNQSGRGGVGGGKRWGRTLTLAKNQKDLEAWGWFIEGERSVLRC